MNACNVGCNSTESTVDNHSFLSPYACPIDGKGFENQVDKQPQFLDFGCLCPVHRCPYIIPMSRSVMTEIEMAQET